MKKLEQYKPLIPSLKTRIESTYPTVEWLDDGPMDMVGAFWVHEQVLKNLRNPLMKLHQSLKDWIRND